jgi:FtsP/CotA-like multicopper oxidase with cupredoxin domain
MGSVKVVAGITLLLGVGAAAIFARVATSGSAGMQEIRLEVHDMTYYIDGQNDPNPTLHVRRGEHVRILLRNADAGMSHDFSVRAWGTGTRLVHGLGEAAVEFTAPDTVGEETYACTPHGDMMHGTLRIE